MMKVRLFKPNVTDEHLRDAERVLKSGSFIMGEDMQKFEQEFAYYIGAKHCLGVNSGTDALVIALKNLGLKGKEVITTSHTFISTANAIVAADAKPVFADIDPDTFNIDPKRIEEKMTGNTKAVIAVHLYGHPCEMDSIKRICAKHGLMLIEDVAQACGAGYKGVKTGKFGDVGCFSFYPSKTLGCFGDGGAAVTDSDRIKEDISMYRNYGQHVKYHHDSIGFNSRLDNLQAAMLRTSLRHLDASNARRIEIARMYDRLLKGSDVVTPKVVGDVKHVYYLYVIMSDHSEALRKHLNDNGVETGIHYPIPCHLQKPYMAMLGCREGDLPVTEDVCKKIISIPMYPQLTSQEVGYVAEKILEFKG